MDPVCQFLHEIWVTIREENDLSNGFKKLVNEDAVDLLNFIKQRKFLTAYENTIKKTPLLVSMQREIEKIKSLTAI